MPSPLQFLELQYASKHSSLQLATFAASLKHIPVSAAGPTGLFLAYFLVCFLVIGSPYSLLTDLDLQTPILDRFSIIK